MMKTRDTSIKAAVSCIAIVCGTAFAHDLDRSHSRGVHERGTYHGESYTRTGGTFMTPVFPTAGGNSAEPERTGFHRYSSYALSPHDDRFTPNPRAGESLPTGGGNSAEPDKTGTESPAQRSSARYPHDSDRSTRATGARYDTSMSDRLGDRGYRPSHRVEDYDRSGRFTTYPPGAIIGDPFPTAGGDSAEPEKTGRYS
jgi:hypothetical protein